MDTKRVAGSMLVGLFLAAGAVSACMPPPEAPPAKSPETGTQAQAVKVDTGPGKAPPLPKTMEECKVMAQKPLVGHASKAVGASDPQRQFDDMFEAQHEMFRCCFDRLFAPEAPRRDGSVALLVKVDFTGKLVSSEIVQQSSTVQLPEVQACVLDIARQLAYPKPTNDQDVAYERVFDFKGRR